MLENGAPEHGEHRWGLRGPQAASGPCPFPLLSANPKGGCWGPFNWKNAIMYSDLELGYTGVWQTLVAFIINSEHLVQSQSWDSEMALYAKTVFTKSRNLSSVPEDPLSERIGLTPASCPMTFLRVYIIKYKINPVHLNCFLHLYPKLFLTRAEGTVHFPLTMCTGDSVQKCMDCFCLSSVHWELPGGPSHLWFLPITVLIA